MIGVASLVAPIDHESATIGHAVALAVSGDTKEVPRLTGEVRPRRAEEPLEGEPV